MTQATPRCAAGDELAADIDSALGPLAPLAGLCAAAERLRARAGLVRSRIAFLRAHPERLAALAQQAYRHQNGFVKVRIVSTERFSVRIHLWPPTGRDRGDVNPHGHRWEFASWVIAGDGMLERTFVGSGAGDPDAHAFDRYDYGGTGGALRARERVWLREDGRYERPSGVIYACPRDVVHTVAPIGRGFVATMVVQGPVVQSTVPVYAGIATCPWERHRPIGPAELDGLLAEFERVLHTADRRTT